MRWVLGKSRWVPKNGEVGLLKVGMAMSVARGRPWSPVSVVFLPPPRSLGHHRRRWVGRPQTVFGPNTVAAAVFHPPLAVSLEVSRVHKTGRTEHEQLAPNGSDGRGRGTEASREVQTTVAVGRKRWKGRLSEGKLGERGRGRRRRQRGARLALNGPRCCARASRERRTSDA